MRKPRLKNVKVTQAVTPGSTWARTHPRPAAKAKQDPGHGEALLFAPPKTGALTGKPRAEGFVGSPEIFALRCFQEPGIQASFTPTPPSAGSSRQECETSTSLSLYDFIVQS